GEPSSPQRCFTRVSSGGAQGPTADTPQSCRSPGPGVQEQDPCRFAELRTCSEKLGTVAVIRADLRSRFPGRPLLQQPRSLSPVSSRLRRILFHTGFRHTAAETTQRLRI